MASVNKVIIVGNLGRDPEVRAFPDGTSVANVAIATTDKWKDKQSGELREATEWHRVSFFGRLAEIAGEYLRKGSQVYVEGSLHTRKWTDQSGMEKYSTEIRADQMQMLGGRPAADGGGDRSAPRQNTARQPAPQQNQRPATNGYQDARGGGAPRQAAPAHTSSGFDDMSDDIPFATSSAIYDMTTSKSRRMRRYDY